MILLENQLPFFFLNDLVKLSKPCKGYSLIEFTHRFLKGALGSWVTHDIKCYQFLRSATFCRLSKNLSAANEASSAKETQNSKHAECSRAPSSWSQV